MMSFQKEEFTNSPKDYRIFPILHDLCGQGSHEQTAAHFDKEVTAKGAGGCVTNVVWNKEWVTSEKQIDDLAFAGQMIKEKGRRAWVYDDTWYPSTWANGMALENQEYRAKVISPLFLKGSGRQPVSLELPTEGLECGLRFLYAAFYTVNGENIDFLSPAAVPVTDTGVDAQSPEGDWVLLAFYIRWHNINSIEGTDPNTLPGGYRQYIDIAQKEAVDEFLHCALDPLIKTIPDFSKYFDAIFTDEPAFISMYMIDKNGTQSFHAVPYTPVLFETFQEMHGTDLLPRLACLFYSATDESKTLRAQYYRTMARLFTENYTDNYRAWCHAHGVKFSGHMLLEEALKFHVGFYADLMAVYCGMDIPGFDMLIAKWELFWQKGYKGDHFCYLPGKFASSAARINGHNNTMLEICPVAYMDVLKEHPFQCMMALSTHCVFTGATQFNSYCYGAVADLEEANRWNEYVGRLQYITRNSMPDFRIGVYYPITDAQADFFSKDLEMYRLSEQTDIANNSMTDFIYSMYFAQGDCTVLTEKAILESAADKGAFTVGGLDYKALVIPSCELLPLALLQKLEALQKAGVAVYFLQKLPRLGVSPQEHAQVEALAAKIAKPYTGPLSALCSDLKKLADITLEIDGAGREKILASRYQHEGKTLYFLVNSFQEDITVTVRDKKAKTATQLVPEDGTVAEFALPGEITIKADRGVFVRFA